MKDTLIGIVVVAPALAGRRLISTTRQMVIRAVKMAAWRLHGTHEVIMHSDHGTQFRNEDYQGYLVVDDLVCSMSTLGTAVNTPPTKASLACSSRSKSIK